MSNWQHPVLPVSVTDPFGYRWHPIYHDWRLHRGTDYYASYGQPVYAAAGGVVERQGYNGGEGISVYVRHDDGTLTKYFHNSSVDVVAGQRVVKGEVIARAGTTGDSTGVHVHFEVHIDGQPVDPELFFARVGADGTPDISSLPTTPFEQEDTLSAAERDEIVSAITAHTQAVANGERAHMEELFAQLANVVRREDRLRMFGDKETGEYVAIDWSTGVRFGPTNRKDFPQVWAQELITHPIDIERAVMLSHEQFVILLEHADSVRNQLNTPIPPKKEKEVTPQHG